MGAAALALALAPPVPNEIPDEVDVPELPKRLAPPVVPKAGVAAAELCQVFSMLKNKQCATGSVPRLRWLRANGEMQL